MLKAVDDHDEMIEQLRQQTAWLRLLATPVLRTELGRALTDEKRRAVYELSTGEATTRDIAKAAGVGAGTVSRWWSEWEGRGLMRPVGLQGRLAHIIGLADLGIRAEDGRSGTLGDHDGESNG